MNRFYDLGPDVVAVDLVDLVAVLDLLNQSKRLHDLGDYQAHQVQENARRALADIIQKATE